jgi:diguanylate cyclase (GGDEF)-like protein
MRGIVGLVLSVLAIAGAVLYASEAQSSTAETNFQEAHGTDQIRVQMLQEVRAAGLYAFSGDQSSLSAYVAADRELTERFAAARKVSSDDAQELALLDRQESARAAWVKQAGDVMAHRIGKDGAPRHIGGSQLVDQFLAANAGYAARLAVNRHEELDAAALVPVKLILGMSALFGSTGIFFLRRSRRAERERRRAEADRRSAADRYRQQQTRFSEAMQVSRSVAEANELLVRHLERSIPHSTAVVFGHGAQHRPLELMTPASAESGLEEALERAEDSDSCLAVRFNRRHDRCGDDASLFECNLCGTLDSCSSCQPLLVGGEVLGSVLLIGESALDEDDDRRLEESAAQAAPVLANLRTLELAETRAATDALTELPNKRSLDEELRRMLAQAERAHEPMSLIVIDLDGFKGVNDTYGHETGDQVLAAFAAMLRAEQRAGDFSARSGGEEFVVLLPETDADGAATAAEKLRLATRRLNVAGVALSASFGVAAFPEHGQDSAKLLRQADRALYAAKRGGRDRVERAPVERPVILPVNSTERIS